MPAGLQIRLMTPQDVPSAMRLKEAANWNQLPEDWIGFMKIEPRGCFVSELDHKVVSTATNFSFQNRFGWIGMILVDPAQRRQGIATRMMERSIAYLESLPCPCQRLDATDAGAKVYEKIGFLAEYQVERWTRAATPWETVSHGQTRELTTAQLDLVVEWDAEIFGASRRCLLKWYLENSAPSLLFGDPTDPKGFLVGREGSHAFQLGPLVATDRNIARILIQSFLARLGSQALIADISVVNPDSRSLLEEFGFRRSRVLQRMYRGAHLHTGDPSRMFLLAGFEFG